MWSDLTSDLSFKAKRGYPNLKVLITSVLLVLEVWDVTSLWGIMSWESSDVIRFDLSPLLQGQTRTVKLKSGYNLLIIGPRGLLCETNL